MTAQLPSSSRTKLNPNGLKVGDLAGYSIIIHTRYMSHLRSNTGVIMAIEGNLATLRFPKQRLRTMPLDRLAKRYEKQVRRRELKRLGKGSLQIIDTALLSDVYEDE